jgi:hypothetical protein
MEYLGISLDSILLSVKQAIGIDQDDHAFDMDILIHINGAFSVLYQLGVLEKTHIISSEYDRYSDIFADDNIINMVKLYLIYKTRLGFDSSTLQSSVLDSIKNAISELEWRLSIEAPKYFKMTLADSSEVKDLANNSEEKKELYKIMFSK